MALKTDDILFTNDNASAVQMHNISFAAIAELFMLAENLGIISGDVTGTNLASVVAAVGGSTAANIHAAELLANAAVSVKTALAIVRRDSGGAAALDVTGNVTGNCSGTAATHTGNHTGDVTSVGMATTVAAIGGATAANVASAASLKHTQGADAGLDTGGTNPITAASLVALSNTIVTGLTELFALVGLITAGLWKLSTATDGGLVLPYSLRVDGRQLLAIPETAPTDADIPNGSMGIWNNAGTLTFRIRNVAGTLSTKTL